MKRTPATAGSATCRWMDQIFHDIIAAGRVRQYGVRPRSVVRTGAEEVEHQGHDVEVLDPDDGVCDHWACVGVYYD